jgi:alpha-galactosidase/6-phospho-beta-glucosidase family protein
MPTIKVAVIGAASTVYGPSILAQALLEQKLTDLHLSLFDPDQAVAGALAATGQRIARETHLATTITAEATQAAAIDGADFVINAAGRDLRRRFAMDIEIAKRFLPDHLITEFGGIAGISYSLRQIALVQDLCGDIRRLCPKAKLLNVANPLPRVCQAAREESVETVGFCSAAQETYSRLWQLFFDEPLAYPWTKAREAWQLVMGGTNHFTWLVAMIDRATRKDLLPQLAAKIAAGGSVFAPRAEKLFHETGVLLFPSDNHTTDFLPPDATATDRTITTGSTPEEHQGRLDLLSAIAAGTSPYEPLFTHNAWERPMDLIAALAFGKTATFDGLNLPNRAQSLIPQLPGGIYVEVPATADYAGIRPRAINLPAGVVPYAFSAAKVSDAIVKAARKHSKELLAEAVERDPTILDKSCGRAALDACIAAHSDILPVYD